MYYLALMASLFGSPVLAQTDLTQLCQQFPQDIRCNLSQPQGQSNNQPADKPRVAVLDFDFSSLSMQFSIPNASRGVSEILVDRLVNGGEYSVIERSRLDAILREQNLGMSERVDASTAAQVGRILGVDAVIIGSVTQFDVSVRESGGGAPVFIPFGSFPIGVGASSRDADANVQVNARLVDTNTGEILATAEGRGNVSQSDSTVTVAGFGGGAATSNEEKLLVMASQQAVDELAAQLNDQASRLAALPAALPTTNAVVADVFGNQVILNKGSQDGYQVGMNFAIERVVRDVLDPQTGAVLRQITEPAGQIQLTEVDGGSSVGRITS
ncbi:MAG: penicillin-binding protein activator LpoB, partial [Synechococcaceae cyanobacterium SM2_3_60]|nr:penicillin-binding protein activator LpoB [Synechococcaceae cyanobacterium SM2_3_60]